MSSVEKYIKVEYILDSDMAAVKHLVFGYKFEL